MSWDYGNSTSSLELLEDFSISNNNKNGSEPEANLTYNVITDQQSATHFALSIGTSVLLGMMTLTTIIGTVFKIFIIFIKLTYVEKWVYLHPCFWVPKNPILRTQTIT